MSLELYGTAYCNIIGEITHSEWFCDVVSLNKAGNCDLLNTYRSLDGKPLKEVFLYEGSGITGINDEEFGGYRSAYPPDIELVEIRMP